MVRPKPSMSFSMFNDINAIKYHPTTNQVNQILSINSLFRSTQMSLLDVRIRKDISMKVNEWSLCSIVGSLAQIFQHQNRHFYRFVLFYCILFFFFFLLSVIEIQFQCQHHLELKSLVTQNERKDFLREMKISYFKGDW